MIEGRFYTVSQYTFWCTHHDLNVSELCADKDQLTTSDTPSLLPLSYLEPLYPSHDLRVTDWRSTHAAPTDAHYYSRDIRERER
ncbi:unnamed protein product [Prunus armeniaca]|uniref:Uncharacterized protein n=1 Tax=Prunus armeniaca TaxID=36596 RepID=A0A6J5UP62_PRUAR|nr:unnamed protein product [Prunus armeniaca]